MAQPNIASIAEEAGRKDVEKLKALKDITTKMLAALNSQPLTYELIEKAYFVGLGIGKTTTEVAARAIIQQEVNKAVNIAVNAATEEAIKIINSNPEAIEQMRQIYQYEIDKAIEKTLATLKDDDGEGPGGNGYYYG